MKKAEIHMRHSKKATDKRGEREREREREREKRTEVILKKS
jgi:hypothetical protein